MTAIILLQTANENLLIGYMPEPLGLLIFGLLLILIPVVLRKFFDLTGENENYKKSVEIGNIKK